MRVPGAARAVLLEHLRQAARVIGEMLKRHSTVLDEGHGLPLVLHRHHDVEAGGAHLGDGGLQFGIQDLDHPAPLIARLVPTETKIADQLLELPQQAQIDLVIVFTELDQEDRRRRLAHEPVKRRLKDGDLARQLDHGAVDQFDRDRLQPHQMLRRVHRLVEAAEMHGADGAPAEKRRQLQFDARREAERAFRADQDMRQIDVVLTRHQRIEIVTADASLHFGKARFDLGRFARADRQQILGQRPQRRRHVGEAAADAAEMRQRAISQNSFDRQDVVAHGAVTQRTAAARIIAGHAAECRARGSRDVDGKPETMGFKLAVQLVEHDARLDRDAPAAHIEIKDTRKVFRAVDDQAVADRLPTLRGAAATRQDGHALRTGNPYRPIGFLDGFGRNHAHGGDLVVGCVRRVAAAGEPVEANIPGNLGL